MVHIEGNNYLIVTLFKVVVRDNMKCKFIARYHNMGCIGFVADVVSPPCLFTFLPLPLHLVSIIFQPSMVGSSLYFDLPKVALLL